MSEFRDYGVPHVIDSLNSYAEHYCVKGYITLEAATQMIALLRIIREELGGKYSGASMDANLFVLDFCRRYSNLINPHEDSHVPIFGEQRPETGCVDIWEE